MLALLVALLACTEEAPILSGLEDPAAGVGEAVEARPYQKPEGVLVDVPYLGGRSWEQSRDLVSAQLGDIQEVVPLDPRDGTEYRFASGHVRVHDDLIYLVHVDLPRATRRSSALLELGFPPQADRWFELHDEFRLRWFSNFERLRMGRAEENPEMVTWVEAMRWNPRSTSR
ncbi:MAG: hypothetical protein H6741_03335 [Alphaproteobacteria bacterium]|nr:hypothetical protein [Alphaproteobacteria bacterium]